MIEPEVAFYELEDNMELAEDFLKYLIRYALDHCEDDLAFLQKMYDPELIERLKFVVDNGIHPSGLQRRDQDPDGKRTEIRIPGQLGSRPAKRTRTLPGRKTFQKTGHPDQLSQRDQAFYMKLNEDGKTVRAMDVLFPKIGEIIGGSQREDNYDKLNSGSKSCISPKKMSGGIWIRVVGARLRTAVSGWDSNVLLLFVTGMANIRDVIPFPRTPKNADFRKNSLYFDK